MDIYWRLILSVGFGFDVLGSYSLHELLESERVYFALAYLILGSVGTNVLFKGRYTCAKPDPRVQSIYWLSTWLNAHLIRRCEFKSIVGLRIIEGRKLQTFTSKL